MSIGMHVVCSRQPHGTMRRSHLVCWHTRHRTSSKALPQVAAMSSSRAFQGDKKLSMYTSYVFFPSKDFSAVLLKRSTLLCWI